MAISAQLLANFGLARTCQDADGKVYVADAEVLNGKNMEPSEEHLPVGVEKGHGGRLGGSKLSPAYCLLKSRGENPPVRL